MWVIIGWRLDHPKRRKIDLLISGTVRRPHHTLGLQSRAVVSFVRKLESSIATFGIAR